MIRVLYFSTARAQVDQAEVGRIVESARVKNMALGITGALAYNGRNFCQVLEGRPEVLLPLLGTIEKDPRHGGFKVLDEKEITDRHFPNWSMQRVDALDFSTVVNAMNA